MSDHAQTTIDDLIEPRIGMFGATAPETSRVAAINVYWRSGIGRRRVLDIVAAAGERGLTCDEAETLTGIPHQSMSARWHECWRKDAVIEETGRTRPTKAGAAAEVFVLSEKGARLALELAAE